MFAYDFDGNGTNDVFTALAAHRYGVAVFLQNKPEPNKATWNRVMLASEQPQDNDYGIVFSQPHAAHLADIDGDGVKDIVTGKRYWAHNGLLRAAAVFLPFLEGAPLAETTVGFRVLPEDEMPILGFAPGRPNLYVAAMHSGVTLAPLVGQHAATEILDGIAVEAFAPYRLSRFA